MPCNDMLSKSEKHFYSVMLYMVIYAKQSVCFLTLLETTLLYPMVAGVDHQYIFNIQI